MVSLAGMAYYLFILAGGIGFGYFVLRLTNPDVRLMRSNEKLGASAVYGIILFAMAFAIDYFVSSEDFLNATGFLPATIFFTILASIFFLKLKNMLSSPKFLVVGVPAVKTQTALEKQATQLPARGEPKPPALGAKPAGFLEIKQAPKVQEKGKEIEKPQEKIVLKSKTLVQQKDAGGFSSIKPERMTQETKYVPATPAPALPAASWEKRNAQPAQSQEKRGENERIEDLASKTRQQEKTSRRNSLSGFFEGVKQAFGAGKADETKELEFRAVKDTVVQQKSTPSEIAQNVLQNQKPQPGQERASATPMVGENVQAKAELMRKIKETEIDEIAKELVGEKGAEGLEDTTHRRYLVRQEAGAKPKPFEENEKEKEQHAQEDEFDSMVQEVYNQLQLGKTRAEVSDKLKLSPPPAESVEKKIFETPVEARATPQGASLFQQAAQTPAPSPAPSGAGGSGSIFDQLNVISGGSPAKAESDVKFVKMPANGAGCPRCHANNSRIVFCPYCGSGMCANCAPVITPKEEGFEYTCPKCGEGVFVKKQSQ